MCFVSCTTSLDVVTILDRNSSQKVVYSISISMFI